RGPARLRAALRLSAAFTAIPPQHPHQPSALPARGPVAARSRLRLRHELALLRLTVRRRSRPVVDARAQVDPHLLSRGARGALFPPAAPALRLGRISSGPRAGRRRPRARTLSRGQVDPPPVLLILETHDRVDLPEGAPRVAELLRVLRVQHQPAAHPD